MATQRYEANVAALEEYLWVKRGLSQSSAVTFRLGKVPEDENSAFAGRLAIPGIGSRGVYSLRFRCLLEHDHGEVGCPKYLGFEGVPTRLFNVRAVSEARAVIHITEGELDTITLAQCGLPAVAVPGANNWKPHHARVFAGFDKTVIWGDADKAGRDFARDVASDIGHNAYKVKLPDGMDVNSLYVRDGQQAILDLAEE